MPEGGILDSGSAGQRSWCAQGCVGSTPHYSGGGVLWESSGPEKQGVMPQGQQRLN